MPTYEYKCTECESINVEQFSMASRPDEIKCACGSPAKYIISAPNLMIKEAMLDGTKRKGWAEFKEASALNKEMRNKTDIKDKQRIEKQIKDLGVQIRKD